MSYIDQNLMVGENIIHRTQLHWIVYLRPAILFVFTFMSIPAGPFFIVLFVLATIITGIDAVVAKTTSEFAITNKRVLVKVGWIRRRSVEVLLAKIEGIGVDQGILGRILNYGTIVITGTGGTREPFHKITSPLEFRKWVQNQIAAIQESK